MNREEYFNSLDRADRLYEAGLDVTTPEGCEVYVYAVLDEHGTFAGIRYAGMTMMGAAQSAIRAAVEKWHRAEGLPVPPFPDNIE